jgi:hypothetical protein
MSRLVQPEVNPLPDVVVPPATADYDRKSVSDVDVKSPVAGPATIEDIPVTAPVRDDEPIVTRRELWAYYRAFITIFTLCSF